VVLLESLDISLELFAKPHSVMAFGETDGASGLPQKIILSQQPRVVKVPVLGTVKDIIKAGAGCFLGLISRAAQGFGQKNDIGPALTGIVNQTFPKLSRHLIRGIAPEPIKTECQQVLHDPQAIVVQTFRVLSMVMIELRQVFPNDFF